jgi:hypothetical protein
MLARHFGTLNVCGPCGDIDRAATLTPRWKSAIEQRLLFFKMSLPRWSARCGYHHRETLPRIRACETRSSGWGPARFVPPEAALAETAVRCNRPDSDDATGGGIGSNGTSEGHERNALAEVLRVKAVALQAQGHLKGAEARSSRRSTWPGGSTRSPGSYGPPPHQRGC